MIYYIFTSVSKQKFRGSHAKLCVVEIPDSVDFFQKEISIPHKTTNLPKFINLVSRNVGLNSYIKISARLFISANYQYSQNRQNRSVNTREQQNTRAELETFEQSSPKMSHKQKFAAYLDDNSLR